MNICKVKLGEQVRNISPFMGNKCRYYGHKSRNRCIIRADDIRNHV